MLVKGFCRENGRQKTRGTGKRLNRLLYEPLIAIPVNLLRVKNQYYQNQIAYNVQLQGRQPLDLRIDRSARISVLPGRGLPDQPCNGIRRGEPLGGQAVGRFGLGAYRPIVFYRSRGILILFLPCS